MKSSGISQFGALLLQCSTLYLLLMAVASIVAAFMGAEGAQEWMTGPFGAAMWVVLAAMLIASLIVYPAIRRRGGLLAIHLGCILILVGAIAGSQVAQAWRAKFTGDTEAYKGLMVIHQGESENTVLDISARHEVATLDFDIRLERFWIEHYPVDRDEPWGFWIELAVPDPHAKKAQWQRRWVDWSVGRDVRLPGCEIDLHVADYHLRQLGTDTDAPILPEAVIRLSRGEHTHEQTLTLQPGEPHKRIPLARLYESARDWHIAGSPVLYMQPPTPRVKDYFSELVVLEGGVEVKRETIEVNRPLHYGGYHFTQRDYDHAGGTYTVLGVVNDQGLSLVYIGFVAVGAGLAWHVLIPRRRRRTAGEGA